MRTTTIKELGSQLPVGALKDGALQKDLSLRPYKAKVDRHLATFREANEGKSVVYLASKFLSLIVESAGGVAYPLAENGDSTPETEFRIRDWFFGDAMYAYVLSRILNVGQWIEVPYRCPRCGTKGIAKADLYSTEVKVLEKPEELFTWVTLQDGIKLLESNKVVKRLKLQPAKFRVLFLPGMGASNINTITYASLRECVVEIDGAPGGYVLRDEEIDEISKRDLLILDRRANDVSAGVDMRTTLECPKSECGVKIRDALNWAFDPFFDSSVPLATLTG